MHPGLHRVILEYQAAVAQAVELLLKSGFERTPYDVSWPTRDRKRPEALVGGVLYFKHGSGYAVQVQPHSVDFDFGPSGETNRFDLYRLYYFSRGRLQDFGLSANASLDPLFDDALREGSIRTNDGEHFYLTADDA